MRRLIRFVGIMFLISGSCCSLVASYSSGTAFIPTGSYSQLDLTDSFVRIANLIALLGFSFVLLYSLSERKRSNTSGRRSSYSRGATYNSSSTDDSNDYNESWGRAEERFLKERDKEREREREREEQEREDRHYESLAREEEDRKQEEWNSYYEEKENERYQQLYDDQRERYEKKLRDDDDY